MYEVRFNMVSGRVQTIMFSTPQQISKVVNMKFKGKISGLNGTSLTVVNMSHVTSLEVL